MKKLLFLSILSMWVAGTGTYAQNWRTPNPNQPNGYRATSAAYHYSGSYKEPAQPSNGYRASEARSHVGMNSFAPPSSAEKSSGRWGGSSGGRFGGSEGSRFGGSEGSRFGGSEGSRFGGSENRRWGDATGSSFQTGGNFQNRPEEWNEFYKRRFEATEYGSKNSTAPEQGMYSQQQQQQRYTNAQQQYGYGEQQQQQFGNGQSQYGIAQESAGNGSFGGYSQPGESFGSAQAMRAAVGASAVRRMLRNHDDGNFNRVYSSNSGGFNRIYGGQ